MHNDHARYAALVLILCYSSPIYVCNCVSLSRDCYTVTAPAPTAKSTISPLITTSELDAARCAAESDCAAGELLAAPPPPAGVGTAEDELSPSPDVPELTPPPP